MHTSTAAETGNGASGGSAHSCAAAGSSPSASASDASTLACAQSAAARRRRSSVAGGCWRYSRGTAQGSSKLCKACPAVRSFPPGLLGRACQVAGACMQQGHEKPRATLAGLDARRTRILPRRRRIPVWGLRSVKPGVASPDCFFFAPFYQRPMRSLCSSPSRATSYWRVSAFWL